MFQRLNATNQKHQSHIKFEKDADDDDDKTVLETTLKRIDDRFRIIIFTRHKQSFLLTSPFDFLCRLCNEEALCLVGDLDGARRVDGDAADPAVVRASFDRHQE